jgi:exodeoxyribonuclease VII small subunit
MSDTELDKLSFEEALTRLETIVDELDTGHLPLEQALERFREGTALKALCERKLAEAEAVVKEYVEESKGAEG